MSSSEKVPLKKVSMIQLGVGREGGALFTKMLFSSSDNESRNWFSGFGRFEARLHNLIKLAFTVKRPTYMTPKGK